MAVRRIDKNKWKEIADFEIIWVWVNLDYFIHNQRMKTMHFEFLANKRKLLIYLGSVKA